MKKSKHARREYSACDTEGSLGQFALFVAVGIFTSFSVEISSSSHSTAMPLIRGLGCAGGIFSSMPFLVWL
jgi:hypothetical protein